jgi:predicted permease
MQSHLIACHRSVERHRKRGRPWHHNRAMFAILSVTFPFFALVFCGFFATRKGLLPLEAIPGLNTFVLFFALPCMLFRFGSSTPIAVLLDPALALVYLTCALIMVALLVLLTRNAQRGGHIGWNDAAMGALVGAFPNTGFMGVPLLVAFLGASVGPAILTIVIDIVLTSSLCIALSRLDRGGGDALGAAKSALTGVASNPMPWSILLGAVASANGLVLPAPLASTLRLLADSASPVALFTLGAVLARSHLLASQDAAHAVPWQDYVPIAVAKLLLHPVLLLGLAYGGRALGLPLDSAAITVVVLVAALPSAGNVTLLAERLGANNGRIARIILVSTVGAFFTFSAAVALLLGR